MKATETEPTIWDMEQDLAGAEGLGEDSWPELIVLAQRQKLGLGILIEADRRLVHTINRLNDSTTKQQETTNRLTWVLVVLTVVIIIVTVAQVGIFLLGVGV